MTQRATGRRLPDDEDIRTAEIRGSDRDALDAVLRAFVVLARARPDDGRRRRAAAPEDVSPDMRRGGEDLEYREYAVDRVIGEWMNALMEQAHGRAR